MMNKRYVWSALLIAFFAIFGASRVALAFNESEPNDPVDQANSVDIGSDGTATVVGGILNTASHRDVDFYKFTAQPNDQLTVSIDTGGTFSPIIAVFGPDGTELLHLWAQAGLGYPIQNLALTDGGIYVVGVSSDPGYFMDVNTVLAGVNSSSPDYGINGTYTLQISGVSPTVVAAPPPVVAAPSPMSIGIKIRPFNRDVILAYPKWDRHYRGGRDFDGLRHHFKGGIAVALLSSADFTAPDVDQSSLRFGSVGDEDSLIRCKRDGVDVNRDGRPDLVCYFDFAKANIQPGDTEGFVTGTTGEGAPFQGQGFLKILSGSGRDRDHHHRHHHHR